jgi:hypothetical protein
MNLPLHFTTFATLLHLFLAEALEAAIEGL